jgi:glycosyltransferase involved in cell wall biosynthesis
MRPLVSIVIPCFNAADWIEQTIESCYAQSYLPIEVIVVDDGSTDSSAAILRRFGSRIRLEVGPNRGANVARNRGFRLSSGSYVQFLDADDYLFPHKLEAQVNFLESAGADVVYGDWRHQVHLGRHHWYLDKIRVSHHQSDVLLALLRGWWVAPGALLYRREIVDRVGGWDESFAAAQDRDFFTSIAMSGADIRYQADCGFVYRHIRFGEGTLSTSNLERFLRNHCATLEKSEAILKASNRLEPKYAAALARSYYAIGSRYYRVRRSEHVRLLEKVKSLSPEFEADEETIAFKAVQYLFGFAAANNFFCPIRVQIAHLRSWLKRTFVFRWVIWLLRLRHGLLAAHV